MKRALILGGSGHLGSALCAHARPGTDVTSTYHSNRSRAAIPFVLESQDILPEADLVIGAFPLARQLQDRSSAEIAEVVHAYVARCGGGQIVQLSTDAVFSGRVGGYNEAQPTDPTTTYGRAQAAVDEALLACAPNCLIVRTSFIFGWAGDRFDKRLAPFANGEKVPRAQTWTKNVHRAPTEVNFLAEAIWRAAERGVCGVLNIAGTPRSIYDFFAEALGVIGAFEMPPPSTVADPSIAADTTLLTVRMEAEIGLVSEEVWEWYRRFVPRRQNV